MTENNRDTAMLLQEWGVWLKQGNGYNLKSLSSMHLLLTSTGGDYHVANISDDDALEVDRGMAKLKFHRPTFFEILWLACVCGHSFRSAAETMKISQIAAAKLYECAYTWIDFYLNVDVFLSESEDFLDVA